MNRSRAVALVFLACLSFVSWLVLKQSGDPDTDVSPEAGARMPDYSVDQFKLVTMQASGIPAYRLQAESLLHFPIDKWSDLTIPRMQFYQQNKVNWQVRANQGRVYDEQEKVLLSGNVILTRPANSGNQAMKVHTESLLVYTDSQTAETKVLARMDAETQQMKGVGLQADMKKGKIKFLSDVEGVYRVQH